MSRHDDQALLEAVRIHRDRLRGAFLRGPAGIRQGVPPLMARLVASLILAAVVCAVCVGISFVLAVIPKTTPSPAPTTTTSQEGKTL